MTTYQLLSNEINHIDDVIRSLDRIVDNSLSADDSSGYFAALYRKVTIKVKAGIANDQFENGPRMEQLDVIFAKRYLDARVAWQRKESVTASWQKAFEQADRYWPIVLQHLLLGMNAHINLDLGIAAATVSKGSNINDLQKDFNTINTILSSLVVEVQNGLAATWPTLKRILQKTRNVDDFLVDYSMQLSRDGAWQFALSLAGAAESDWPGMIAARDKKVADKSAIVTRPGMIPSLLFGIIRLGERGSVQQKIKRLT